jgi:hypothetical protein
LGESQHKHYLRHDHTWVQLASSQLFGLLFSNYSIDDLINSKTSFYGVICLNEAKIDDNTKLLILNHPKLAEEVQYLIKKLIGVETFSDHYSMSNKKRSARRDERKRKMAQLLSFFIMVKR